VIISHKHKFAFVHIPKTGGTSVTSILKPHLGKGPSSGKGWQAHFHTGGMHSGIHRFHEMGKYFKFAFVRNPWDWLVSLYSSHAQIRGVVARGKRGPAAWDNFIELVSKSHLRQQASWLMIGGKVCVDHVARFENFTEEVGYIFNKLGFKYKKIPHRLRRKRQRHYVEWYNKKAVKIVAKAFGRDIKLFGYKFGV